jgi:hypothetical protein
MKELLVTLLLLAGITAAQVPTPALPRSYISTTFSPPTGTSRPAHTSTDFKNALNSANPGDTIVLDAGAVYRGNFTLPAKTNPNNQWIYIVSSAYSSLPVPGTRVAPVDAANMPKIVSPYVTSTILAPPGANHYRLVGLEVTTASTQGGTSTQNPYTSRLVDMQQLPTGAGVDSITVDRCYIHASPTIDARVGVNANASNVAVIDSYISDIHQSTNDSQAIEAYYSNGPIKIVNNYLEATTENVMFGGAGTYSGNPFVASDVEIRNNWFFKPLSWIKSGVGGTLPPNNQWVAKNLLEFKCAQRVLVDGNLFENVWPSGQTGWAFNLKPLTTNGSNCVEDDITITNNVLKNVSSGISLLSYDPNCPATCGGPNYGEMKRVVIANNLILLGDTTQPGYAGGYAWGMMLTSSMTMPQLTDILIQHNTVIPPPNLGYCKASVYFEQPGALPNPPASRTQNVWILDNVFCRQINGAGAGYAGQFTFSLTDYMGNPGPPEPRFRGNVFYAPKGDKVYPLPLQNYTSTVPFIYVNPAARNYQLSSPSWTNTSDGNLAGVNNSALP